MKPIVYPYKMGSGGARALATALGTKRVRPDGRYVPKPGHLLINWGNPNFPEWWGKYRLSAAQVIDGIIDILNYPDRVAVASNKLTSFEAMKAHGVAIPDFTANKEEALAWRKEGSTVVVRHLLRGSAGRGIEIVTEGLELPNAPLYVRYIKKASEYRIHVLKQSPKTGYPSSEGEPFYDVIDAQQKRKKSDKDDVNYQVRNHDNGWVFCRDGVNPPASVTEQAKKAVAALGLDFGAVDIIHNTHYDKSYVLEINTAPGLEGTTLTNYVNAFQNI